INPFRGGTIEMSPRLSLNDDARSNAVQFAHSLAPLLGTAAMILEGIGIDLSGDRNADLLSRELALERIATTEQTALETVAGAASQAASWALPFFVKEKWVIAGGLALSLLIFGWKYWASHREL